MGNAIGLKIKKINEDSLLKDVVFNHDKKIVEFVYYITKLNKYYVENFRKNVTINEFTLCNVYTKKEYNVVIERVESGYFFDGLEYSVETIPTLEKVLFVSYVSNDGAGHKCGVNNGSTILLGNEEKYFTSLSDVESEIKNMNAKFLFYDFEENYVKQIDFEEYRDKSNNELRMGIEIEERNVKEIDYGKKYAEGILAFSKCEEKLNLFVSVEDKLENNERNVKEPISNTIEDDNLIHIEKIESTISHNNQSYNLIKNIDGMNLNIKKEENHSDGINASFSKDTNDRAAYNLDAVDIENKKEDTNHVENMEETIIETEILKPIYLNENNLFEEITINNDHIYIHPVNNYNENENIQIQLENITNTSDQSDQADNRNPCNEGNNLVILAERSYDKFPENKSIHSQEMETSHNELKIDLKESISFTNQTNPSSTVNSSNNEKFEYSSPSPLLCAHNLNDNTIKIKSDEYTKNLKKCKKKYSKKLSIYEKIDSQYNFMSLNKVPISLLETAYKTLDRTYLKIEDNLNTSIKKKIFIKGYDLDKNFDTSEKNKSIKILDLHQNTKRIPIANSSNFI